MRQLGTAEREGAFGFLVVPENRRLPRTEAVKKNGDARAPRDLGPGRRCRLSSALRDVRARYQSTGDRFFGVGFGRASAGVVRARAPSEPAVTLPPIGLPRDRCRR